MGNEQAREIVARLREINAGFTLRTLLSDAADEIERLCAGGCARDQRTTQYCAEAVRLESALANAIEERDAARREICESLAFPTSRDPDYHFKRATQMAPTPENVADMRGWDLYRKAKTNGD